MTREQASNILDDYDVNFEGHTTEEIAEAFDMAFKALEQECGMREATKEESESVNNYIKSISEPTGIKFYEQMPKTGHWIKSSIGGAKIYSICQAHMGLSSFKFCPNCGARMERGYKE